MGKLIGKFGIWLATKFGGGAAVATASAPAAASTIGSAASAAGAASVGSTAAAIAGARGLEVGGGIGRFFRGLRNSALGNVYYGKTPKQILNAAGNVRPNIAGQAGAIFGFFSPPGLAVRATRKVANAALGLAKFAGKTALVAGGLGALAWAGWKHWGEDKSWQQAGAETRDDALSLGGSVLSGGYDLAKAGISNTANAALGLGTGAVAGAGEKTTSTADNKSGKTESTTPAHAPVDPEIVKTLKAKGYDDLLAKGPEGEKAYYEMADTLKDAEIDKLATYNVKIVGLETIRDQVKNGEMTTAEAALTKKKIEAVSLDGAKWAGDEKTFDKFHDIINKIDAQHADAWARLKDKPDSTPAKPNVETSPSPNSNAAGKETATNKTAANTSGSNIDRDSDSYADKLNGEELRSLRTTKREDYLFDTHSLPPSYPPQRSFAGPQNYPNYNSTPGDVARAGGRMVGDLAGGVVDTAVQVARVPFQIVGGVAKGIDDSLSGIRTAGGHKPYRSADMAPPTPAAKQAETVASNYDPSQSSHYMPQGGPRIS